jgi:hypothetical protein
VSGSLTDVPTEQFLTLSGRLLPAEFLVPDPSEPTPVWDELVSHLDSGDEVTA